MTSTVLTRMSGCIGLLLGAAALAGNCYISIPQEDSCTQVGWTCDISDSCQGTVAYNTEAVTTTSGGQDTGMTAKVAVSFSCYITFKTRDAQGFCTVDDNCNLTVDGNVTSGFHCGRTGPPA